MIAATALPEIKAPLPIRQAPFVQQVAKQPETKRITWEEFERRYLSREDKFKYEWVNGEIEKTERAMNQYQTHIATNLIRFFFSLFTQKKVAGRLSEETDTFFLPKTHRRPDLAWFSERQLARMAHGENQVPEFVIEVISTTDQINKVGKKMRNYRDAGVKVVWLIFPLLEEVQIHHGAKSEVFSGDQVISAAPVLPAFSMKVCDVFKKPEKQTT